MASEVEPICLDWGPNSTSNRMPRGAATIVRTAARYTRSGRAPMPGGGGMELKAQSLKYGCLKDVTLFCNRKEDKQFASVPQG